MHLKVSATLASLAATLGLAAFSSRANAAIELSPLLAIDAIYTDPSGGALLILNASNPACGSSGNQFHIVAGAVSMTADGVKTAVAAAFTAYALGKPIRVYFDPTIYGCPIQQLALYP